MILQIFGKMVEFMLLEFGVSNYKSFKDKMLFSMVPAPKQKGLDYSILTEVINKKTFKALCSSVIYGPNASGKSNIIGAMDTFRMIVLRGNIRNKPNLPYPNQAACLLELIPNSTLEQAEPVRFYIKFINEGLLVEYRLSLDLGKFLEHDYKRKILSESLKINGSSVFDRTDKIEIGSLKTIKMFLGDLILKNSESAKDLALANLSSEELFLTNGFKNIFSSSLVSKVVDWLEKKFIVVYKADAMHMSPEGLNQDNSFRLIVDKQLSKVAKEFGINSNQLGFIKDGEKRDATLYSIFSAKKDADKIHVKAVPAEIFESYGTIRFINTFPLLVKVLMEGGCLIVDEFDASLHPMLLMNIINFFHNDEDNINKAQLIFNTHNPIFLNANLYRRDEIKFVDRDDDTHFSDLYSLSDFSTVGTGGVRKSTDYMNNYFIDRYGAIKNVNIGSILNQLIQKNKENK